MLYFARLSIVATFWLSGGSSKCGFKNWWTMILLMCELGVIMLCVFTVLFIWIETSLNEDPGLSLTLSSCPWYKDHLGTRRCRWHRRKLNLSMGLLMPKPQVTWWCHWYFTNEWGAHELLIKSFQKWQVSLTSRSPHSSRCRMQWVNMSQASSSSRSFLALLGHHLPGLPFSAGSLWNAAELTKGKYCWVSECVHRGHWSWWRWRFPFSFSWLQQ